MSFSIGTLERNTTRLNFALLLRDRLTYSDQLFGDVTVDTPAGVGSRKGASGTFLFFDLPAHVTEFSVRSGDDTPYYLPADLTVALPPSSDTWPAFPDLALANPALMLWDPAQAPAYRAQFLRACLTPAIAYPFDPAATLVRGTVTHGGAPLPGAAISDQAGNALPTTSGTNGEFVLAFPAPSSASANVTLVTTSSGNPDVTTSVTVLLATTTTVRISV